VTFAFGGQTPIINEQRALRNQTLSNRCNLLKRRFGKGCKYLRFAGPETSSLIRLQHQLQSELNQLIVSINRKGLVTFAVPPMTIDCRVSIGESKMMKEAKGFVRETETFQCIKKPDGFDRIHLLLV
jgi:hypothetical protein